MMMVRKLPKYLEYGQLKEIGTLALVAETPLWDRYFFPFRHSSTQRIHPYKESWTRNSRLPF